jgi:hypothetical protein
MIHRTVAAALNLISASEFQDALTMINTGHRELAIAVDRKGRTIQ